MNGFSKMGLVECVPKKRDKLSGFSKKGMNLMKKRGQVEWVPKKREELGVPQLKLEAAVSAGWSRGWWGIEGDRHKYVE